MIVALCLGAIDCQLSGRPRWAFALGALASLGRPEVWPFLGLYVIWAWRAVPSMRRLIVVGIALLLVLWFGIPALTSRSPFVAGTNALGSGRALHNDKIFGTIRRFLDLQAAPLEIVALAVGGFAAWRRDRTMIVLAAGVVGWVVLEIAFALHGWPGLPRYMFEAGAVTIVARRGRRRSAAVGPARDLADRGLGRDRTRGRGLRQPRALRPVARARRAQGPARPADADRRRSTGWRDRLRARRGGADARVRRAAHAPRVPDDPRLAADGQRRDGSASSTPRRSPAATRSCC